jgi:hypothetical protein
MALKSFIKLVPGIIFVSKTGTVFTTLHFRGNFLNGPNKLGFTLHLAGKAFKVETL